ncbi:ATP-binding protein [Thiospirochaeta perfilievii]|uniref:ATP-binding protein n=1 Tax=Thiospirochaeta perfilievii TaxID=252967 RepID=A0A5C1QDY5_9SPIO|nr:ATP-binding protein [Thiospirochaeta perfilievii]QEN05597.1 ATP-binding protein [Thiospirochaeta perfilievii]
MMKEQKKIILWICITLYFLKSKQRKVHTLSTGYEIYVGKLDNKEVDFVVIDGNNKFYIQVTYLLSEQSTIDREFSVLEQINDNYTKIVISMDTVNRSRNGIIHKNIKDFLLEE